MRYLKYKEYRNSLFIRLNWGHEKWDAKLFDEKNELVEVLEVTHLPRDGYHIDRLILSGRWKDEPLRESFINEDFLRQASAIADFDNYINAVINKIILKKNNKYQDKTTLIVSLADEIIMERKDRFAAIVAAIEDRIEISSPFRSIYLTVYANSQGYELGK